MEFRTLSVPATPLNLVQVKVDFWGIFRLSSKVIWDLGLFWVQIRFAIVINEMHTIVSANPIQN